MPVSRSQWKCRDDVDTLQDEPHVMGRRVSLSPTRFPSHVPDAASQVGSQNRPLILLLRAHLRPSLFAEAPGLIEKNQDLSLTAVEDAVRPGPAGVVAGMPHDVLDPMFFLASRAIHKSRRRLKHVGPNLAEELGRRFGGLVLTGGARTIGRPDINRPGRTIGFRQAGGCLPGQLW